MPLFAIVPIGSGLGQYGRICFNIGMIIGCVYILMFEQIKKDKIIRILLIGYMISIMLMHLVYSITYMYGQYEDQKIIEAVYNKIEEIEKKDNIVVERISYRIGENSKFYNEDKWYYKVNLINETMRQARRLYNSLYKITQFLRIKGKNITNMPNDDSIYDKYFNDEKTDEKFDYVVLDNTIYMLF